MTSRYILLLVFAIGGAASAQDVPAYGVSVGIGPGFWRTPSGGLLQDGAAYEATADWRPGLLIVSARAGGIVPPVLGTDEAREIGVLAGLASGSDRWSVAVQAGVGSIWVTDHPSFLSNARSRTEGPLLAVQVAVELACCTRGPVTFRIRGTTSSFEGGRVGGVTVGGRAWF